MHGLQECDHTDEYGEQMTLEHFLCLLERLEQMYKLLTPAQLTNKIRMLGYNSPTWTAMVGSLLTPEEGFVTTSANTRTLDMLKKMMRHNFEKVVENEAEKGVEMGVVNVKGTAVAMGMFLLFMLTQESDK